MLNQHAEAESVVQENGRKNSDTFLAWWRESCLFNQQWLSHARNPEENTTTASWQGTWVISGPRCGATSTITASNPSKNKPKRKQASPHPTPWNQRPNKEYECKKKDVTEIALGSESRQSASLDESFAEYHTQCLQCNAQMQDSCAELARVADTYVRYIL